MSRFAKKILLAFIAIFITKTQINSLATRSRSIQNSNRYLDEQISSESSPISSAVRFRRAAPDDILKDYVEKMQVIARLSNVIYLQQGLSNGTIIKTEQLIQELLHFGSITTGIIGSLDLPKIENALISLKKLPNNLTADDKMKKLEDVFLNVKKVLNAMKGLPTATNWNGKEDYKNDLAKLEQGEINLADLINLNSQLTDWKSDYKKVMTATNVTTFEIEHMVYLKLLRKIAKELKQSIETFKSGSPVLFEFKGGKKAVNEIKSLIQVRKAVVIVDSNSFGVSSDDFAKLDANAKLISDSVSQMTEVATSLENIKTLYFSRLNPATTTSSEYTSGLPDGYDDVTKLSQSFIDNEWFKKLIKNDSLSRSYPSVQSLGISVNSIQKLLGVPDKKRLYSLSDILKDAKKLQVFAKFPLGDCKKIVECFTGKTRLVGGNPVDEIALLAEKIDGELGRLSKVLDSAATILIDQEKDLNTLIGVMDKAIETDPKTWEPTFKALFDLKELETVNVSLSEIKLEGLDVSKIQEAAKNSSILIGKVLETYESNTERFHQHINNLLSIKDAQQVVDAVEDSKKLREYPGGQQDYEEKFEDGLKYVQDVVNTKNDLGSLKKAIEAAKGTTTLESGSLNLFQQSDIHTDIIGLATRAIVNMKSLLEKKNKFDVIKTSSKLIKDEMNKNSNLFNQTETESLNSLTTLGTSLDKMFIDLNTWKDDVSKLQLTSLKSYSKIFAEAKKVNPLSVDLGTMSLAMEKLIDLVQDQKSNQPLQQVKTAVDTLNGLQFSKYSKNFDSMEASLDTMNMFFANYLSDILVKLTPKQPPSDPEVQVIQGPAKKLNGTGAAAAEENSKTLIIVLCVGGAFVIALLVVIGLLWYYCWREIDEEEIEVLVVEPVDISLGLGIKFVRSLRVQIDEMANRNEVPLVVNVENENARNTAGSNDFLRELEEADSDSEFDSGESDSETEEEVEDEETGAESSDEEGVDERVNAGNDDEETDVDSDEESEEVKSSENAESVKNAEEVDVEKGVETAIQADMDDRLDTRSTAGTEQVNDCPTLVYLDPKTVNAPRASDGELKKEQLLDPTSKEFAKGFKKLFFAVDGDMKENTSDDISELVKKNKKEVRHPIELVPETRIKVPRKRWYRRKKPQFASNFFHGNLCKMKNNRRLILCQGAQKTEGDKISTIEKLWYIIMKYGVQKVVMLCQFVEFGENKCDQYFPLEPEQVLKFTDFSVQCVKKAQEGKMIRRELILLYNGESHKVEHVQYVGWPDKSVPSSPAELAKLWKEIRGTEGPITIHCSDGIGRTGSLAMVETILQHIHYSTKNGRVDFGEALRHLREQRACAVQNWYQFAFSIMTVLEMLFSNVPFETTPPTTKGQVEVNDDTKSIPYADYQFWQSLRRSWPLFAEIVEEELAEQRKDNTNKK